MDRETVLRSAIRFTAFFAALEVVFGGAVIATVVAHLDPEVAVTGTLALLLASALALRLAWLAGREAGTSSGKDP